MADRQKAVWALRAPDKKTMGFVRVEKKAEDISLFLQCVGLSRANAYCAALYDGKDIHDLGPLDFHKGAWVCKRVPTILSDAGIEDMAIAVLDQYAILALWGCDSSYPHTHHALKVISARLREPTKKDAGYPSSADLLPPETIFSASAAVQALEEPKAASPDTAEKAQPHNHNRGPVNRRATVPLPPAAPGGLSWSALLDSAASRTAVLEAPAARNLLTMKGGGKPANFNPGHAAKKTPCQPFPDDFPESNWIRVDYPVKGRMHHYLLGEISQGGVPIRTCCAVPGQWQPQIPAYLQGFTAYKEASGMEGRGYYLMFKDV